MRHMNSSHLRKLGLLLGSCTVALVLAQAPAHAMDDGDDTLIHEFTSLVGIQPDSGPDIDYRDRAPLVLPPKGDTTLPKPVSANEKPNPQWPNDPDVARARRKAAEARMPVDHDIKSEMQNGPKTLDKDGRLASRLPTSSEPTQPQVKSCNQKTCPPTPEEVAAVDRALSGLTQPDKISVGQEPPREWLTEPPKGYRKMTEVVTDKDVAPPDKSSNPFSFLTNLLPK